MTTLSCGATDEENTLYNIGVFQFETFTSEVILSVPCEQLQADCRDISMNFVNADDKIVQLRGDIQPTAAYNQKLYSLLLFNLSTGEVLYNTQVDYSTYSIGLYNGLLYISGSSLVMIDLDNDPERETVISDTTDFRILSADALIFSETDNGLITFRIYEPVSQQFSLLTQPLDTTLYSFSIRWLEDGSISVIIYDELRSCCNERFPLRRWIVQAL